MSQTQATHTESLDGNEPDTDVQKKAKNRRPASKPYRIAHLQVEVDCADSKKPDTAFRQQRLKAWQSVTRRSSRSYAHPRFNQC